MSKTSRENTKNKIRTIVADQLNVPEGDVSVIYSSSTRYYNIVVTNGAKQYRGYLERNRCDQEDFENYFRRQLFLAGFQPPISVYHSTATDNNYEVKVEVKE